MGKSKMGTEMRDSPAQTTSPEGSTASDMNCAGSGLVSVSDANLASGVAGVEGLEPPTY